jgi:hypothetical protein
MVEQPVDDEVSRRIDIGLRCGEVADLIYPHNNDRRQRDRLALALVELTRAISPASLD